jgi:hypothetical protein
MVTYAYRPSYSGDGGRRIRVWRPYLKNKLKAKGLEHTSNGRVLAYQVGGPEFNP